MKASIIGRVSVRAGFLALAACALCSGAAMAAESKPEGGKPQEYKSVKRGGIELFCRTDPVTGSRTQKKEACLTQEQIDKERARGVNIVTGK